MHKELVQAIREASGTPDTQVGGYLKVLIERFGLIGKLPVFAKPEAKRSRYYVTDNFLRSWLARWPIRFLRLRLDRLKNWNLHALRGSRWRPYSR